MMGHLLQICPVTCITTVLYKFIKERSCCFIQLSSPIWGLSMGICLFSDVYEVLFLKVTNFPDYLQKKRLNSGICLSVFYRGGCIFTAVLFLYLGYSIHCLWGILQLSILHKFVTLSASVWVVSEEAATWFSKINPALHVSWVLELWILCWDWDAIACHSLSSSL